MGGSKFVFRVYRNRLPPTIQIAGGGIPSVYTVESVTELKGIKYGKYKELTATEKLKYRIAVKMTAADYFRLLTRSHEAGVSPSEYMRECFRNGHVKERLSEEHAGYIRQLCGMANNLNQLARKANAGGFHDERWDCKVAVARIHELITKIGI